jgi:hypothetical protein
VAATVDEGPACEHGKEIFTIAGSRSGHAARQPEGRPMSRPQAHEAGSGPADPGAVDPGAAGSGPNDVAALAARLAAIRREVDRDPEALAELLHDLGADLRDTGVGGRLPAVLALLDELETLVDLLAERGVAAAAELSRHDRRRRALGAYRSHTVRP